MRYPDRAVLRRPLTGSVQIDIKPDGYPNGVNPRSRGVIPVAVLGTDIFDVATVDESSLRFGPDQAHIADRQARFEDVNFDGIMDLTLHFRTADTGIACGDESATLTGETLAGQRFEATDSIQTVGCRAPRRRVVRVMFQHSAFMGPKILLPARVVL